MNKISDNYSMKVFQIGFNKCGTDSISRLFKSSGYNAAHWEKGKLARTIKYNLNNNIKILTGIENFMCYTDLDSTIDEFPNEAFKYFKEIDKQYPGSKFILNLRNIDTWIESRIHHNPFGKNSTKKYSDLFQQHYGLKNIEEVKEYWKNDWETHIKNVLEYFKDRPDDLIVFNIETDNIDKLINFFNKFNIILYEKHWGKFNARRK
jgi:hypothetical protein